MCLNLILIKGCEWPEYFDLSTRGFKDTDEVSSIKDEIQTSWQTNSRIKKDESYVNTEYETMTLVNAVNKTTIEISDVANGKLESFIDTYKCKTKINNDDGDVFMIEKVKTLNITDNAGSMEHFITTYRCLRLKRHSKFVLQWVLGPESISEPMCDETGVTFSEWPLVYWPITDSVTKKQRHRNADLFRDYPACPMAGGYLMHVYNGDGSEIKGCQNNNPSSKFEMECVKGEGLLLMPGQPTDHCLPFAFNKDLGSKFYCLGAWTDSQYQYTVLVPNQEFEINSFHCLRTNLDDPTTEPAILFLDNVCKSSKPNPRKENFLRLGLRQKHINSICDDYSDQCAPSQIDCKEPTQSTTCLKSCGKCPALSFTKTDPNIHGSWIIQKTNTQKELMVHLNRINIPDIGLFDVRLKVNTSICSGISWNPTKTNRAPVYVLTKSGSDAEGCLPRVATFSLQEVTKGVAVLFYSPTAPLRNLEDALDPINWCKIVKKDYMEFASFFKTYSPEVKSVYSSSINGWYIAVHPGQEPAPTTCGLYDVMFSLDFRVILNNGTHKSSCTGRAVTGETSSSWKLTYDHCSHGKEKRSHIFTCLASIEVNSNYKASIMQAGAETSNTDTGIQPGGYYCVMFPKKEEFTSYGLFSHPVLINPTSSCDDHFIQSVVYEDGGGNALVRMDYGVSAATNYPSSSNLYYFIALLVTLHFI